MTNKITEIEIIDPVNNEDSINISELRLPQDFSEQVDIKKIITKIPVKKPSKQDFIRVHPDYSIETNIIELKEQRETYLVHPNLWKETIGETTTKVLYPAMNRQGLLFVWPIKTVGHNGELDSWNSAALEAAEKSKKKWIRISANMSLGGYEVFEATANLSDPEWPDLSFDQIINIAFKGQYIKDVDHIILRKLRGEI